MRSEGGSDRPAATGTINAAAWLCWFAAACALPLTSRNPFYLLLSLGIVAVVYLALPRRTRAAKAWTAFVVVGGAMATLSILFNVLTVHVGDATITSLPEGLPIIGGRLTWNAFGYGATTALAIGTLLLSAATFNTAVRHSDLLRLTPARIDTLGMVSSIALGATPATLGALRDVYDAQRARGVQIRGPRDAAALITPVLGMSLERAVTYAEALECRGYGARAVQPPRVPVRLVQGASGIVLLAALLLLGRGLALAGMAVALLSVLLLIASVPPVRRTRYRRLVWSRASVLIAALAIGGLLLRLVLLATTDATLAGDAFPRLTTPPFSLLLAATLLPLLAPALVESS